jgi:UDP:flavonoid glycosyltransferase YjiC (YdhE family)
VKLLVFPFGSHGDVHPFIGLSLALKERGHDVTCVVNSYFSELLRRTGLDFVEMGNGDDFLELAAHPDLWHPVRSFRYLMRFGVGRYLRAQYELVAERYVPGETIVIGNCLGFGLRFAQEKLGVPLVTVHLQPSVMWSEHESPALSKIIAGSRTPRWLKRLQYNLGERLVIDRASREATSEFREELGLPPLTRTTRWWHSPECVLGLFPEWYAPPQPDWPPNVHLTQFPLWDEATVTSPQAELEDFLNAGEPPIVFTPGSANIQAASFFAAAAEACRRLDRRGLFLSKFAEQIPSDLPVGVKHFDYVPFSRVLPRAAAVVHHGGIGTTAQGLRAGIPQLIMPLSHDQPDNAARLKRLGVGDSLLPKRFRGAAVAGKLQRLLDSSDVKNSCSLAAERFAGVDPFAEACNVVDQFAQRVSRRDSHIAPAATST